MVNRQNTILLITAIFLNLIFHEISFSQSPTWAWAKSGQGIYHDWVEDMFIDISGNCLITGKLQSNSVIFGTDTLIDQGPFVVKYSTTGDVIWAKSFHDYGGGGFGIASDADNNIYITGYFGLSGIQFDSISLNSLGSSDIYIAKLDSNGNVIWAESAGTINFDFGSKISVDTSGNVYLAGIYTNAPLTFDSITLNNDFDSDIFVAKYSSAGNVLWARSINGDEHDGISNISVDRNGDIALCGEYRSSYLHFGTDTIFNLSSGSTDIFLAKYDANGNFMWSNSIGGYSWDYCKDMNISSNNQIYLIGGYISPYFTIDSINTINHLQGFEDVFILKYDSNGSFIWSRTLGGSSFDSGRGITSDSMENIYITGIYNSMQIDFGATILSNNNPSDFKIFVAKYDSTGNENWVLSLGTSDDNWSKRIKNYNNESIFVTGTFNSNTLNIGPFNISGTNNSNHTIFTAKLTDISTSAVEINDLQSLAVYPNPNSGKFSIRNEKAENLKITVQNIQGEIISISESSLYSIDFNLNSLRPGVYILRIDSYNRYYRNEKVVIY